MKRSILIILLLVVIFPLSEAQLWKLKKIEIMGGFGASMFFGDVGGYSKSVNNLGFKDMSFLQTRYDLNLSGKYRILQNLNARVSFTYGLLHATDERGSNEGRNYETTTSIFEPALLCEYFFVKNNAENSYLFNKDRGKGFIGFLQSLDFYAFTGIGGLSYSIKANDALVNHGLDPGGFTAVIPVGLGSILAYTSDINLGFEFSRRYCFSDNIDGYTSQYSSSNDVYYFFNFTVSYKFKTRKSGSHSFRR